MTTLPEPGAAMVSRVKRAVTPVGSPVALRVTALLNPSETEVVKAMLPALSGETRSAVGDAERIKVSVTTRPSTHPVSPPRLAEASFMYSQRRVCVPELSVCTTRFHSTSPLMAICSTPST